MDNGSTILPAVTKVVVHKQCFRLLNCSVFIVVIGVKIIAPLELCMIFFLKDIRDAKIRSICPAGMHQITGGNLKCINFMPKKQELCGLQAQVVMLSHRLHANEVFLILFNHTCEFFTATIQPNYGSVLIRSTYTTSY
jgi:hypothetical protein